MKHYEDDSEDYSSDEGEEIDIHALVSQGTKEQVEWALSRDRFKLLNFKNKSHGRAPIHTACTSGRLDMVLLLLRRGAEVDFKDKNAQTALHLAAELGNTELCLLLLEEAGASIKCKDDKAWTCLHHAVSTNSYETAELLIARGVDLSAEEQLHGRTALHMAAEKGLEAMCELLIARGADMYASGDAVYSKTPLHLACIGGFVDVVAVLLKRGANIEALSGFLDKSPLHLACEKGHTDCAQALLEAGAGVSCTGATHNGATPLHLAAQFGHPQTAALLLRYQVRVRSGLVAWEGGGESKYVQTQLTSTHTHTPTSSTHAPRPTQADMALWGRGTTVGSALHVAAQHGQSNVVRCLLQHRCLVDQKDNNGCTALHTACRFNQYECGRELINRCGGC